MFVCYAKINSSVTTVVVCVCIITYDMANWQTNMDVCIPWQVRMQNTHDCIRELC